MPHKLTAVVIDDETLCLDIMREILEENGFEVRSFVSAESFVRCAENDRQGMTVDLLVTDNLMPQTNGLQMLEEQLEKGCRMIATHRAILSGSWTREDRRKAEKLGCVTFEKPLDFNRFYRWLGEVEGTRSVANG